MIKQLPISIESARKSDVRSQFAALCWRLTAKGSPELLLITTRRSGRWIIPRGWPMDSMTPADSAAQEAWEEAGVIGAPLEHCLGSYFYSKTMARGRTAPCVVMVYPLQVISLAAEYPEAGQRQRKWVSPCKAAEKVNEPELARILRDFNPAILPQDV
ncbi:NUDIX hydrolase [Pontibaca salina]|uniref:NUDIX hydrolase n=1 Tax=Pontibaca salina TaxID=2795731 RepID=A0A934HP41_9RHOB|nr:NUDIX hydrolase [Pontibaca salina]MBI6628957.1 NUDIX hydrolase [Pontibaca salina]